MSEASIGADIGECVRSTIGRESGAAAAGLARYLSLAAAPTFALMALLEAFSGGLTDALCVAAPRVLPLNGMVVMYALMSIFHAAPWLAVISGRRSRSGPPTSVTGSAPLAGC